LISVIKLIDGTELLGEVIDDNKDSLMVKEPLKIILSYLRPGGYPVITMHRYTFFAKEELVSFKKQHIISYGPVKQPVDVYYTNSLKNQKEYVDKAFDSTLASVTSEMMDEAHSDDRLYKMMFEQGVSSSKH